MKGKYEKLQALIEDDRYAVLVCDELNQYYLTGFEYSDGYVLVTKEKTYLLCDFRYLEAAKKVPGVVAADTKDGGLKNLIYSLGLRTVGYEDASVTVAMLERFKSGYPGVAFQPIDNLISSLREYKDKDELEAVRSAQRITDQAFAHILSYIKPGVYETDVMLELEFFMRRNGAQAAAFDTICISGEASSLPHGKPQRRKLQPGFLTMDFGAKYDGYCSDMTRTVVIGQADSEMKKLYRTVLQAQCAALDFIREGALCREADRTAREIIERDYPNCFGHSLGHGVGLYVHENPRVSAAAHEARFSDGHVVTVEPGIYIEGKYGCRIEDLLIFHDGISEDITQSPKELIEIG